jgi:hypothetical protein
VSTIKSLKLSKAAVVIGGFLVLAGVIFVGIVALLLTQAFNIDTLERVLVEYRMLFLGVLFAVGVLDVVSGIILRHR